MLVGTIRLFFCGYPAHVGRLQHTSHRAFPRYWPMQPVQCERLHSVRHAFSVQPVCDWGTTGRLVFGCPRLLGTIRLSICGYPTRAVRLQHTFQHIGYIQLQLHRLQRYAALAALCCDSTLFPTELCPFNSLQIFSAVDSCKWYGL